MKLARHLALPFFLLFNLVQGMYVETYWESWIKKDFPDDYCALLKDVPASPVGSYNGVNFINIAFGDYSGGFNGVEADLDVLADGIEAIHAKGGKVKVAYGGALASMSQHISSITDAHRFAESIRDMARDYKVDGVDFDVEDGGAGADIQAALVLKVRELCGSDFHISYTISCLVSSFEPWKSTIPLIAPYVDAVNVMAYDYYWAGYNFDMDVEALNALGVPTTKIVWGLMPGHHDAANEYTSLEDAVNATNYAKELGLAGMMTWDINRDCDRRQNYPQGEDNLFQTGKPPATFVNLISKTVNQ